jgi:putative ABC transport system substrate-binding protein
MWATVKTTNQHLPSTRATQRLATGDLARFTVARLPALLALALLTVSFAAEAQPPGRVYRIGYLRYYACAEPAQFTELRQGLRELGYAEGHNLVIECRGAPGQAERIPDLATELVRLNVDVIVAEGTVSALAAKQATRTIPIVMVYIADPVASGLIGSLGRPGGNVTGSTMLAPEIIRKTLQLLKEAVPAISRVTVLIDSSNPGQTLPDQQMAAAAEVLGVRPQRADIVKSSDLDKAFAAVLRQRAQALLVYPLPLTPVEFQRITEFAIRNRLPTVTWHPAYVREGLLMFYGTNVPEQFRRAGVYIDKILKSAKPADLPVEQPTKFDLIINQRTARALGLTIPPSLLVRADGVIE